MSCNKCLYLDLANVVAQCFFRKQRKEDIRDRLRARRAKENKKVHRRSRSTESENARRLHEENILGRTLRLFRSRSS